MKNKIIIACVASVIIISVLAVLIVVKVINNKYEHSSGSKLAQSPFSAKPTIQRLRTVLFYRLMRFTVTSVILTRKKLLSYPSETSRPILNGCA